MLNTAGWILLGAICAGVLVVFFIATCVSVMRLSLYIRSGGRLYALDPSRSQPGETASHRIQGDVSQDG